MRIRIPNYKILGMEPIKYRDFIITLFLMFLLSVTVHEYGHLTAIKLLGGQGEIKSSYLNGCYVRDLPPEIPYAYEIVKFMGGYSVALFYGILAKICSDPETKLVRNALGIQNIVYGTGEGLLAIGSQSFHTWTAFSALIMVVYILYQLRDRPVIMRVDGYRTYSIGESV